jgi:hypothetical protein
MVFLIRLSAIPVNPHFASLTQGHFTTPLFSSIDEIHYKEWLYMVLATSWKVIPLSAGANKFGIPVYIGHLLSQNQTSWVGSILVVFSSLVTIGVAVYLYRSFRAHKQRNPRIDPEFALAEGETEFEVAPIGNKALEREALVRGVSDDDDDFFFAEEHEIA